MRMTWQGAASTGPLGKHMQRLHGCCCASCIKIQQPACSKKLHAQDTQACSFNAVPCTGSHGHSWLHLQCWNQSSFCDLSPTFAILHLT